MKSSGSRHYEVETNEWQGGHCRQPEQLPDRELTGDGRDGPLMDGQGELGIRTQRRQVAEHIRLRRWGE